MTTKCPTGYQMAAHENQSCNCIPYTDRAFYDAVYTILVDEAGAYAGSREREDFIRAYCDNMHPATEYRFGGSLGGGGKFWRGCDWFHVSCYREDETPQRLATIEKVNVLLAQAAATNKPRMR